MATQANEYFVITDGTTTCTFSDGSAGNTDYRLVDGWAPAVAHLSKSQLGGRGPYEDVTEQADILVKGASWNTAKDNVAALERLMQQAVRWARGENVAVVLVKWAPKGSQVATTAAPFQAVVLGGAFTFKPVWTQDQNTFQTNGTLAFKRRGAWLLAAPVSGSSSSTAAPGPFTVTGMTSLLNVSPVQAVLKNLAARTAFDFIDSTPLFLSGQQGDLQVVTPFAGSTTRFTVVADAANAAVGGSVLRYTATVTSEQQTVSFPASGNSTSRRFAIFAALRNNSASTSFLIRTSAQWIIDTTTNNSNTSAKTPYVTIDTAHTRPRFIPLGIIAIPSPMTSLILWVTAAASTGSPTLDINYVVAQAIDSPYARAVQLTYNPGGFGNSTMGSPADLYVDPQPLTAVAPAVYHQRQSSTDTEYLGYYGDAYPVAASTTFQAVFMGKSSSNFNDWVYPSASDGSASTAASLTLTANRYNAYLVPE